jgi:hypothetical protein
MIAPGKWKTVLQYGYFLVWPVVTDIVIGSPGPQLGPQWAAHFSCPRETVRGGILFER